MTPIDTLIKARWVIPVKPHNTVLESSAIAIHQGEIIDILPFAQAESRYQASTVVECPRHVLMPGLVNTHTHLAMSLFRGMADDLPLMDWLNHHIWPAENTWVYEDFCMVGNELAMAELIKSGTTCFNDMYHFPNIVGEVADRIGLRGSVGLVVIDFPTTWAKTADEYIEKAKSVHAQFKSHPRLVSTLCPHAPYSISDAGFERVVAAAHDLNTSLQIHVHETAHEITEALASTGKRPLKRLAELGVLSKKTQTVHMTQIVQEDIEQLQSSGAHVVHCPQSNLKLADGFCPVNQLMQEGVNVALGTDGAASNNRLDMLGETQTAARLAKAVADDATALSAADAIQMATLNGAKAMGLDHLVGSIEQGKRADIIAIDLDHLATQPCYNPISQVAYAAHSSQITHVWVDGKCLLEQGVLTTVDEQAVMKKAKEWQAKLSS